MKRRSFSTGGIHPHQSKITAGMPPVLMDLPMQVELLLSQHIGAPAVPIVKKGDRVNRMQPVAKPGSALSVAVHSPITGIVKDIRPVTTLSGYQSTAIVIESDPDAAAADSVARKALYENLRTALPLRGDYSAEHIREAITRAGIVGLGGAAFPSAVKYSMAEPPDMLIVNACECEPYLTCDDALMREFPAAVIAGIRLVMVATGAVQARIGIEDNKPEAIDAMRKALTHADYDIQVVTLATKYPQGGEKQLVQAITGHRIPKGALPASVGVVVTNVATAFAVYQAVALDVPLIERVVTLTGDIPSPGNYIITIGTPVSTLIPSIPDDGKLIAGGPMMGRAVVSACAPVTKGLSGLLLLTGATARRLQIQPCIRCASCVDACPMGLEPYLLSSFGRMSLFEDAINHRVTDCIECGSCSYICPSARPLLDYIRLAKSNASAIIKSRKS